jgi:alpha-beta hydrolase superfamily lysophospholipase
MHNTSYLSRPLRRFFSAPPVPAEKIDVTARDGWRLALHRVTCPGAGAPVLLVHGLAANRHAFHLPGRSLAHWLASRGFDCYVAELRGHGESERRHLAWQLDDYLNADVPALVEAVLERSGHDRLSWIGHSMGGIALLAYGILHPEAPFARAATIGSALDLRPGRSDFGALLGLVPALDMIPALPVGVLTHWLAPLLGRAPDPVTSFNFWLPNVEPEIVRRAHAMAFHTVPASLLRDLTQLFEPGGLRGGDGFVFAEHADQYRVPTLLLAASRDRQVPAAAVAHTGELLAAEVRTYGREHGHREEYGHWDLILGRYALEEVWPDLASWLDPTQTS